MTGDNLANEDWHWPPSFDETYRPDPAQAYWFPERETMPAEQRDGLILRRIQDLMDYAYRHSPFYRQKWDAVGLELGDIQTLEDFESVPVVTKEELRSDQEEHQPFGSYLCCEPGDVRHIHGTSGTTGRPTAFGISGRDWSAIANAHARVMWGMGIRPRDTVLIGSFFSLYMGSWGALVGAERLGASVFPLGAGVPGHTQRAVNWMVQMRPTVFYGTPSYALRIAEIADEMKVDPLSFGIERMFFSGEPGASVPVIRKQITERFGARVFDSGSMAEVSPWMNLGETTESRGMLCWQDIVYTEVVDPNTYRRVPYGMEGTPVYTTLERTSQPMIRLLSKDLTRWEEGPSDCGRTYPSLPRGVYGRIDDMFTIRGENVYPSTVDETLRETANYGGEHRIIISRSTAMDVLRIQVEYSPEFAASPNFEHDLETWRQEIGRMLQTRLGVGASVDPVPPGHLERTEFKARRVIDERDVLAVNVEGF